jgi:hypothetical protein
LSHPTLCRINCSNGRLEGVAKVLIRSHRVTCPARATFYSTRKLGRLQSPKRPYCPLLTAFLPRKTRRNRFQHPMFLHGFRVYSTFLFRRGKRPIMAPCIHGHVGAFYARRAREGNYSFRKEYTRGGHDAQRPRPPPRVGRTGLWFTRKGPQAPTAPMPSASFRTGGEAHRDADG